MDNELYLMYRRTKVLFMQGGYACKINEGAIAIDADGAPNAYGPPRHVGDVDGSGLDSLTAACYPPGADDPLGQEDWTGILVPDPKKPSVPYIKADGFYVSQTTLSDPTKSDLESGKFVDSSSVPYIVMPQFWVDHMGMNLGDLCVMVHPKVLNPVVLIVADFCPFMEELGEISIKAAFELGASEASPRDGATFPRGKFECRMFKNSAPKDLWPLSSEKLQALLPDLSKKHNFNPQDPASYASSHLKIDTP